MHKITWVPFVVGALGLSYSEDSPAPPIFSDCTTGTPASLVLYSTAPTATVPVNSYLESLVVYAYDSLGNRLRDIDITLVAPGSGPSGTFNVFTDSANGAYTTTPNPLTTTISTGATCGDAKPIYIANNVVGSYQLVATAGSATMSIPVANKPASPATIDLPNPMQIAHIGTAYRPFAVKVRDAVGFAGVGVGGISVTFSAPTGSGATGTFPSGASVVTAVTNAFGVAKSPPLTANGEVGHFNVSITAGPISTTAGPYVNGGGTVTTLYASPNTPNPLVFGTRTNYTAAVEFNGFPGSGTTSGPANFPKPHGSVLLQIDGRTVDSVSLNDLTYEYGACATCADLTLMVYLTAAGESFGTHQVSATYQPTGEFDASSSSLMAQTVVPAFIVPTADGTMKSMVGITDRNDKGWTCTLRGAAWVPVSTITNMLPADPLLPLGLFTYQIDSCGGGISIGIPLPTDHAVQQLVFQFPQPLPPTAKFVAFGPTQDNANPHWYPLPTQVDGTVMRVSIGDGDPGDDDLIRNSIITGRGAIVSSLEPIPIPALSTSTLIALASLIVASLRGNSTRARDRDLSLRWGVT